MSLKMLAFVILQSRQILNCSRSAEKKTLKINSMGRTEARTGTRLAYRVVPGTAIHQLPTVVKVVRRQPTAFTRRVPFPDFLMRTNFAHSLSLQTPRAEPTIMRDRAQRPFGQEKRQSSFGGQD
jgi:hypothetical protein